jgi:hypothetical protein
MAESVSTDRQETKVPGRPTCRRLRGDRCRWPVDGMERGLTFFGGSAATEIYDNMKTVRATAGTTIRQLSPV